MKKIRPFWLFFMYRFLFQCIAGKKCIFPVGKEKNHLQPTKRMLDKNDFSML